MDFLRRIDFPPDRAAFVDAPDAVVSVGGRLIGVEHCELTEESFAATERNIGTFEDTLSRELASLGFDQSFSLGLGLDPGASLFRKLSQVNTRARKLARFIYDQVSTLTVGKPVTIGGLTLERCGFSELTHITLTLSQRTVSDGSPQVIMNPAFSGPGTASARDAVRSKERHVQAYREKWQLDEIWLLLVTGASWLQATNSLMTQWLQLSSKFDAVYLLDVRSNALQRLDAPKRHT